MKYSDFMDSMADLAQQHGDTAVLDALSRVVFTTKVPTMATNATNIFVNPTWVDELTSEEVLGVLWHELLHDLYGHHTASWAHYDRNSGVSQGVWHELANIAMDIIINDVVRDAGYSLPKEGAFRESLEIPPEIKTSHAIFKRLLADYKSKKNEQAMQQAMQQLQQQERNNQAVANEKNQKPSKNGFPMGTPQASDSDDDDGQGASGSSSSGSTSQSKQKQQEELDRQKQELENEKEKALAEKQKELEEKQKELDKQQDGSATAGDSDDEDGSEEDDDFGDSDDGDGDSGDSDGDPQRNGAPNSDSGSDMTDKGDVGAPQHNDEEGEPEDFEGEDDGDDDGPTLDEIREQLSQIVGDILTQKLNQVDRAPSTYKEPLPPLQSWVDMVFETTGRYLAMTSRDRTYQRPGRRPAFGLPGSELLTPMKGSRPGDYKPRVCFYVDVSGSMYWDGDVPNEIRAELQKHMPLLRDTRSVVIPFNGSLLQPMDIDMLIPNIGGDTNIRAVIDHINSSEFEVSVIVTDCNTSFNVDDLDRNKMVIVVTNQPNYVRGDTTRQNIRVIGVDRF